MDYLTAVFDLTGEKPLSAPIITEKSDYLHLKFKEICVIICCDKVGFSSNSHFELTQTQLNAILFIQDWLKKEIEKVEEIWDLYVFDKWGEDKVLVFSEKKSLVDEKFDTLYKTNCFKLELRKRNKQLFKKP